MRGTILVIDDDHAVRKTICDNLVECGYEVCDAEDGEQGLKVIKSGRVPQVVITDIIMPQKEGLETIMELRGSYPDIKLIAISGGGRTKSSDFLHLASVLGANATLPKPLDMNQLEETIDTLINVQKAQM